MMTTKVTPQEGEFQPKIRQQMWDFWGAGRTPPCIRCYRPAVTIHEEPPRSLNPEWEDEGPEHFLPLCAKCHDNRHAGQLGAGVLMEAAVQRLQHIGEWKPDRIVRELDGIGKDNVSSKR